MDGLDGWKEPLMFLIPANASPKKASAPPITRIQAKKDYRWLDRLKERKNDCTAKAARGEVSEESRRNRQVCISNDLAEENRNKNRKT